MNGRGYARAQARCKVTRDPYGHLEFRHWATLPSDWSWILASFKMTMSAESRLFDGERKAWIVDRDYEERFDVWLVTVFEVGAIDDERDRARSRSSGSGSSHQRQREPPPKADPPRSTLDDAYGILHLRPSAPLPVVEAAYRALAKQTHPDHGGSHEAQKTINAAVALIRDAQARRTGAA